MEEELSLFQTLRIKFACVKVLENDFMPTIFDIQFDFEKTSHDVDNEVVREKLRRVIDFFKTKLDESVFVCESNTEWISFLKKMKHINVVTFPIEPTDDAILLFIKWKINSICENVINFVSGTLSSFYREHDMIKQNFFGNEKAILNDIVQNHEGKWWTRSDFTTNEFAISEEVTEKIAKKEIKIIEIPFNEENPEKR